MTEPVDSYTRSVALIVGLVAAALLARLAIQPFFAEAAPTATFIVATGAATILMSWRAGLSTLVLSIACMWFFILPPAYSFEIARKVDFANIVALLVLGSLTIGLGQYTHVLRRRTAENAKAWCEVVERLPVPVAVRNQQGRFLVVSDGWLQSSGYPREMLATLGDWIAHAHPGAEAEALKRIPEPSDSFEDRTREPISIRTKDGKIRFWDFIRIRMPGLLDPKPHLMIVALDRTDEIEREAQFRLVVRELNHRLRNMLTVIRSTATQALRASRTVHEARERVTDQIGALVAAYNLIMDRDADVTVTDLLDLEARSVTARSRLRIRGDDISVSAQSAVPLALILHEVATNAAKYGAWSNDDGIVDVEIVTRDNHLHIEWKETGGPDVTPPDRTGFGSHLITRAARALGGSVEIRPVERGYEYSFQFRTDALNPARVAHNASTPNQFTRT